MAIPAVIAYNFFQRRVKALLGEADALTNLAREPESATSIARSGALEVVVDAMQRIEWDQDVADHSVTLFETLAFTPDCAGALAAEDVVRQLLAAVKEHADSDELAMRSLQLFITIGEAPGTGPDAIKALGGAGLHRHLITMLTTHARKKDLLRVAVQLLTKLASDDALSPQIADLGTHAIIRTARAAADNAELLGELFALLGQLAFTEANLQAIVQHGGIAVIIEAIGAFPEEPELMKRCIQTIDNIAMASKEYAAIVIQQGGRTCIEELIAVYDDDQEIADAGKSALLAMSVLESAKKEEEAQKRVRHKPARPT